MLEVAMKHQKRSPTFAAIAAQAKITPSERDQWEVVYFKRHKNDDVAETEPGRDYLKDVPSAVRSHMRNVVIQVAAAPPDKFAGGGYWEAMHGDMTGYFEARKKYQKMHYRLFCVLDEAAEGRGPLLVIICGMTKHDQTVFSDADYAGVRKLGDEYYARNPRSLA